MKADKGGFFFFLYLKLYFTDILKYDRHRNRAMKKVGWNTETAYYVCLGGRMEIRSGKSLQELVPNSM